MDLKESGSFRLDKTTWGIVLANAVTLIGVIFWKWDLRAVLFLYWAESAVIGFYNIFKIIFSEKWVALFLVPFFIIHFGLFMFVHLVFILTLFGPQGSKTGDIPTSNLVISNLKIVWPALLSMFVSHGYSFFVNFLGKREYLDEKKDFFVQPYKRVILMHLTILSGGFLSLFLGQKIAALVFFVLLKIFMDVRAHNRVHKKLLANKQIQVT